MSFTLCYADLCNSQFYAGSHFETVAVPAYNGQTLGDLISGLSDELNSIEYKFWESPQTTDQIIDDWLDSEGRDYDRILLDFLEENDDDDEIYVYWFFVLIPEDLD